jgi:glutathione S-transferase
MSVIKLYGGPRSRASIVQWYLEELGLPYEQISLDMQAGEHRQPDYLAINPMGKVPAIIDGEMTLWESGAILLYLADKYGDEAKTPEQRAQLNQWILFANATLGPGIFVPDRREQEMPKLLSPLNRHFEQHEFITGDRFTVADVALGALLAFIPMMLQIDLSEDYPEVANYTKRLAERPAYQKSIGGR